METSVFSNGNLKPLLTPDAKRKQLSWFTQARGSGAFENVEVLATFTGISKWSQRHFDKYEQKWNPDNFGVDATWQCRQGCITLRITHRDELLQLSQLLTDHGFDTYSQVIGLRANEFSLSFKPSAETPHNRCVEFKMAPWGIGTSIWIVERAS